MSWTENKSLLQYSKYTPCEDIFQAACDEIGKHYESKGWKYARSKPKITYKDEHLKVVISFWTSSSNIQGDWVNLEILPNFYSTKLIIKGKDISGFLFGHTGLFYHKYREDNPKLIKVKNIFEDDLERIDEYSNESKLIDSNNCNVYALDENKFRKIIEFIDTKIICWIDKLKTEEGILELTENPSGTRAWSLNGKGGNSEFIDYVKLYFPNIDIEKRLNG